MVGLLDDLYLTSPGEHPALREGCANDERCRLLPRRGTGLGARRPDVGNGCLVEIALSRCSQQKTCEHHTSQWRYDIQADTRFCSDPM